MNTKTIKQAAKDHAKEQLGEDQYKTNKNARESICEDFTAGVTWCQQQLAQQGGGEEK